MANGRVARGAPKNILVFQVCAASSSRCFPKAFSSSATLAGWVPRPAPRSSNYSCSPTGGGIYLLEDPRRTFKLQGLIAGPEWRGHFVTLALSFDARTVYFSFADPAGLYAARVREGLR
jgi:hypothetical protein